MEYIENRARESKTDVDQPWAVTGVPCASILAALPLELGLVHMCGAATTALFFVTGGIPTPASPT